MYFGYILVNEAAAGTPQNSFQYPKGHRLNKGCDEYAFCPAIMRMIFFRTLLEEVCGRLEAHNTGVRI
jgi:hypothetical protein